MQPLKASDNSTEGDTTGRDVLVGHPLGPDTVDGTPTTQSTNSLPDFPFRFKGRRDVIGKGHNLPNAKQVKTDGIKKSSGQGGGSNQSGGDTKKPQPSDSSTGGGQRSK